MAIIRCDECSAEISSRSLTCRKCGAAIPRWKCKFCKGTGKHHGNHCFHCNGHGMVASWTKDEKTMGVKIPDYWL